MRPLPAACSRRKTREVSDRSRLSPVRPTSAEFVDFLEQVVSSCKTHQENHFILDNLSAHKTSQVEQFLQRNKRVKLHFTPTYSSWLNQVEIWFSRLEREVIAPGYLHFSPGSLAKALALHPRLFENRAPLQMEIH
jgi:hypothetical protein